MFITFEGIDGSGKTTQVELLRRHLVSKGYDVCIAREPGGTPIGEQIRRMLLEREDIEPKTEASLFAAARAQLVARVIRPALDSGKVVILDRYVDSSLAYQSIARELGIDPILDWNNFVTDGLLPDKTFALLLPAEDATLRMGTQLRLFADGGGAGPPDRMERESLTFRRAVDEAYWRLARMFPDRIVPIDASLAKAKISSIVKNSINELPHTPQLGRVLAMI
jgi:dTMP kinase